MGYSTHTTTKPKQEASKSTNLGSTGPGNTSVTFNVRQNDINQLEHDIAILELELKIKRLQLEIVKLNKPIIAPTPLWVDPIFVPQYQQYPYNPYDQFRPWCGSVGDSLQGFGPTLTSELPRIVLL